MRIVVQMALVLALIELIFMTEKLNDVLRTAIDQHATIATIFLLLLYRTPEIFDLALPLALLIAVYQVTLRFREERELLVLSGMGIGIHQLLIVVSWLGLSALALSLLASGFVSPTAVFAQRSLLFESYVTALRGGITPGQFYKFGSYTIFAGPLSGKRPERPLFMHQADANEAGDDRVVLARQAWLDGPRKDGSLTLHLNDFDSFSFHAPGFGADADNSADAVAPGACLRCGGPTSRARVGNLAQELETDDLVKFDPRGKYSAEWTLIDVLGLGRGGLHEGAAEIAEFGHRLARIWLCLVAPLVAGLALVFTTRRTHAVILPMACCGLIGLQFGLSLLADEVASLGLLVVCLSQLGLIGLLAALALSRILEWQNAIVAPALSRT